MTQVIALIEILVGSWQLVLYLLLRLILHGHGLNNLWLRLLDQDGNRVFPYEAFFPLAKSEYVLAL